MSIDHPVIATMDAAGNATAAAVEGGDGGGGGGLKSVDPLDTTDVDGESSEMGRRRFMGASGLGYDPSGDQFPAAVSDTRLDQSIRRRSGQEPWSPPSPSSAPATPRITSVTHPSEYIHTQHPRRTSLTPLGLHVISPVAPGSPRVLTHTNLPAPPIRTKGFSPSLPPNHPISPIEIEPRRGSATSSNSTLTQSRPIHGISPSSSFYASRAPPAFGQSSSSRQPQPLFIVDRRRSSLTPSNPSLAPPSPTKHYASGQTSRPTTSDGNPRVHLRHRTSDGQQSIVTLNGTRVMPDYTRRGSMPQLDFDGWNRSKTFNPVLIPPRGSVDNDDAPPKLSPSLPTEGFKFGSIGPSPTNVNVDLPPSRPVSVVSTRSQKENLDVFQQAEVAEAERQRKLFYDATYGEDGRRARQRLSIGSAHGISSQMGKSSSANAAGSIHLRRASLVLWEKMQAANRAMEMRSDIGPGIVTYLAPDSSSSQVDLPDGRRGSLPVDIPGGMIRRASQLSASPGEGQFDDMEEEEPDLENMSRRNTLRAPVRPLPPLLPLSDPGPRLLPSTLALHRANHLLTSRNLQAEPLPHPLPPSLHPPAPVDIAEFDIDFILAGSSAQMGADIGEKAKKDVSADFKRSGPKAPPTLDLARGEGDDTFAKFVGEFDDEYGGRRGRWTFRAVPGAHSSSALQRSGSAQSSASGSSDHDPLESSLRSVWDCDGAGKYELYASGEIRSNQTSSVWQVRKAGPREYELTRPSTHPLAQYVLTSRSAHCDEGGLKQSHVRSPRQIQKKLSDVAEYDEFRRKSRMDSSDSTTTPKASFISASLPLSVGTLAGFGSPKKKRSINDEKTEVTGSTPASVPRRSTSRERRPSESREKGSKSIGGKIRRAIKATVSSVGNDERKAQRDEKEREKKQSASWSPGRHRPAGPIHSHSHSHSHPATGASSHSATGIPGSSRSTPLRTVADISPMTSPLAGMAFSVGQHRQTVPDLETLAGTSPTSSNRESHSAHSHSGLSASTSPAFESLTLDDVRGSHAMGQAWTSVPDEAVAMVIPVETKPYENQPSHARAGARSALLVWYVPFNSENEDVTRPTTANSSLSSHSNHASETTPRADKSESGHTKTTTSIPKFQKLLKRRTSRDQSAFRKEKDKDKDAWPGTLEPDGKPSHSHPADTLHPLPFKSYRVVARVIDLDELRSRSDVLSSTDHSSFSTRSTHSSLPSPLESTDHSPFPTTPFSKASLVLHVDPATLSPGSTAPSGFFGITAPPPSVMPPKSTASSGIVSDPLGGALSMLEGRNFPTVLAVCHSRSSGVEFVLEGLDRLGLCHGPSAWGPTGYEEWRGVGLSESGREMLDLLWAGCVCVMGLV
ncbi:hypothetical protein BD324DRAFT_249275 [Kockovaella imperatae]|uniref:Uncharacterized protein n=1 Tax=Kockovaella imperatae TaxID=4999 RepID=A0A1Y1UPR6_9TREE|nr:hypothetical protein BD324DRAFT_249275 [Kockovaella imperatae]ORX39999.1 hypothetical protein BD324DRAFT_249275 [Kockovaella imperatae]